MNERLGGTLRFARPRWWTGVARILDLGGVFDSYNMGPSAELDARALSSDWALVGHDLRLVMENARQGELFADRI